ncbi:hypothetical protein PT974_05751 [Cladobotryum mycophilum]|uniref:Kelch repeat protein n=1 Tax=Cladobotryum mycophilum TaxID=491253 RepID=A0ABR0SJN1_9HYPO
MEQFKLIRRQSAGLWQNMPAMPSFKRQSSQQQHADMTGTWERIDLPPIPRSSHSLNVISGCAYIFGGEISPRQPIDNDMHVIRLPFSSAGADYFRIVAKSDAPETPSQSPQAQSPKDSAASSPAVSPTEKSLEQLSLESPQSPETAETKSDDSGETKSDTKSETSSDSRNGSRTRSKGKGKERALDVRPILDNLPAPRVGHATATIGARIFVYGGRGGPDMKPLDEGGRVWIFDTRSRTWSYLDPVPAVKGGAIIPHPAPRSYHCATATDRPRDFAPPPPKKAETWQEWALGDTSKTGIPQDPIVGHVAEDAVDEESIGYGTFFVHGGCLVNGDRTNDLWGFDVRSRTWTEFPAAPSPARGGSSICVSKSRLYRFGGYDGQKELGGQLDFLHLEVEVFDDNVTKGEVSIRPRGSWQTIYEDNPDASSTEIPVEPFQTWPEPRSASSLHAVTVGGGTEYLVLTMGEKSPSEDGQEGAGKFFSDVWVFQVPPLGMTAASFTSAVFQAIGRKTGEGKWTKVAMAPFDEDLFEMPRARGWFASAPMTDLEETGILIWGGLDEQNRRRDEGWILRLGQRDNPNGNS